MDFILALPEDFSRIIVTKWLSLVSVSLLDISYCNSLKRPCFLSMLSSLRTPHRSPFTGRSQCHRSMEMISWIVSRNLIVSDVAILSGFCLQTAMSTYLKQHGGSVNVVEIHQLGDLSKSSLIDTLYCVQLYCINIREVRLSYLVNVDAAALQFLAEGCKSIERLHLDYCDVGGTEWADVIATAWPALQEICLTKTSCTDLNVSTIARRCTQLTRIDVSLSEVGSIGINAIAAHCPCLQSLSLNECTVDDSAIAALAAACPLLREISMRGIGELTDACLHALCTHCPSLQSIDISHCEQMTDAGLEIIAYHCSQLRCLDVSKCPYVTEYGVSEVANRCDQLQTIRVSDSAIPSLEVINSLADKLAVSPRFDWDHYWQYATMAEEGDVDGENTGTDWGRGRVNSDY